jgi:hypothetical protein
MKKRLEDCATVACISTYCKLVLIFVLLGLFIISLQVDAAQFEGTNINLPKEPTGVSEKQANQITTTPHNATNLNQAPITKLTNLNVEVASDVYSEKDRQVLYCPKGNYMVVRNRIYLEGSDLDKIKEARYSLHESFNQPGGVVGDPANNFEIWIWTWGGFPIKATITTKTGQTFEKDFDFSFKTKFEEAQSKGIPQTMECNE